MILIAEGNEWLTQTAELNIWERAYVKQVTVGAKFVGRWRNATNEEYEQYLVDYDNWIKETNYIQWCEIHNVEYNPEDDPKYKEQEEIDNE